jgi:uncharacterized membrane protein YgcG
MYIINPKWLFLCLLLLLQYALSSNGYDNTYGSMLDCTNKNSNCACGFVEEVIDGKIACIEQYSLPKRDEDDDEETEYSNSTMTTEVTIHEEDSSRSSLVIVVFILVVGLWVVFVCSIILARYIVQYISRTIYMFSFYRVMKSKSDTVEELSSTKTAVPNPPPQSIPLQTLRVSELQRTDSNVSSMHGSNSSYESPKSNRSNHGMMPPSDSPGGNSGSFGSYRNSHGSNEMSSNSSYEMNTNNGSFVALPNEIPSRNSGHFNPNGSNTPTTRANTLRTSSRPNSMAQNVSPNNSMLYNGRVNNNYMQANVMQNNNAMQFNGTPRNNNIQPNSMQDIPPPPINHSSSAYGMMPPVPPLNIQDIQ